MMNYGFKKQRAKQIESSSRVVVVNSDRTASLSNNRNANQHHDLLAKIVGEMAVAANDDGRTAISATTKVPIAHSEHTRRALHDDVFAFMERLNDVSPATTTRRCDPSMLRSDVQTRINHFKSIVSTCPLYCRLAVNAHSGLVYGAREFNLESTYRLPYFTIKS